MKLKSKNGEILVLLLGIFLIVADFYFIKTPPTLRRVNMWESYILKGGIFLIALFLIIFSVVSISSKNSLMNPKTKKIIINVLTTLGIAIVCLFLLEGFLQLTSQKSCQQEDQILHNSYRPNCNIRSKTMEWDITAEINSQGLRDDEVLEKENYEYRVLILGDSLPAGWGVEHNQTYSEVLQEKLNREGKKVDVLNTAVTGYSPILEYLYLREKGLQYEPDIIILNVDMGDVQGDDYQTKLAKIDEKDKIIGVPPAKDGFLMFLYKKSKVIKLLEAPLIILDSKLKGKVKESEHFYDLDYDAYMLTRGGIEKEEAERYYATVFKHIKLIQELSEENNIKLIITTYPYGHQVSGEEWAKGRHNFGFEQEKVYSSLPNEILADFAEENNIAFISMFPDFKESETFPLYFPYDGHFNEKGHELAAEILFREMKKMDLFEEKDQDYSATNLSENGRLFRFNGNFLYNQIIN